MTNHSFVIRKINDEYDSRGHTKASQVYHLFKAFLLSMLSQSQWMIQLPHGVEEHQYPPDADKSIFDGRTLTEICDADIVNWVPQPKEVALAEEPDLA
jgi:hypothetical protein